MHFDDVSNSGDSFFSAIAHFQSKIGRICPSCKKINVVFHMNIFSFLMKILFFEKADSPTPHWHFHQTARICFVRYDNPRFAACVAISHLTRKKALFSSLFSQRCLYLYIYTLHSRIGRRPAILRKQKKRKGQPAVPLAFSHILLPKQAFFIDFSLLLQGFSHLAEIKDGNFSLS